jgi:MoxR-like ATPase
VPITTLPDLENNSRMPPPEPVPLPEPQRLGRDAPEGYLPDPGLLDAFRVMLLLRRPLLITGEPGTGKTHSANYLNWKLGLGPEALRFDAKTTSSARDLFYSYNTIARFHAAQTREGSQKSVDYIEYTALGAAILLAMPKTAVQDALPADFKHNGNPTQSVVLIDEIDKAPRDFPNDLLNELENFIFRAPELGNRTFAAQKKFQPLVILTSNSEKNLPAAFLRRCVFFHIPTPGRDQFARILESRLEGVDREQPLINDVLRFITFARSEDADLTKRPATAELIDFILVLLAFGARKDQTLRELQPTVLASLSTLVKGEGDDKVLLLEKFLKL